VYSPAWVESIKGMIKPIAFKKGILKLIYDGKYKSIVFYKGGMEKLDRNIYYYKSEIIDSSVFNTFDDFYEYLHKTMTDFSTDYLTKIQKEK
jgi:hypothetical protein